MPATIDNKGIASGYNVGENGWGDAQNQNLRLISAMLIEGFANDPTTTTGLTYGYKRGVSITTSGVTLIPGGTVILPPNSSGYIVRTVAGVVSFQTSALFPDKIHLATVTTNISSITFNQDERYTQDVSQDGTHAARAFEEVGNAALTGAVRLANNSSINARNAANTADVLLIGLSSLNRILIGAGGSSVTFGSNISTNGTIEATGSITALNAPVFARQIEASNLGAAPEALTASGLFEAGNDVALGPLYLQIAIAPSATAGNRFAQIAVGDDVAQRDLHVLSNRAYFGQGPAGFVGAERVRVGGALRTDGAVTATQFNGSGAGLTANTVPQAAVVDLNTALNALTAADAALSGRVTATEAFDARIDAVEAARPFVAVVNNNVPVSRVTFDWASLGYTGTNTGGRAFNSVLIDAPNAGFDYDQAAQQNLVEAVNELNRAVKQLAFDLNSRSLL